MAEEYSTVKVVGGVGFLGILLILGILLGGIFIGDRPPVKPPDSVPCPGGGPNCSVKKANGELAQDGSTCPAGVNNSYVCQVNGAQCGPAGSNGACATVPLGGGRCGCACQY